MTKLGFHAPLTRLYVFIKNEGNALWYYLDDGQKRYIQETALTGTLKRFEVKEAETSFGNELKADFEIVADRRYVLRSGVDTAFTKGILMTIAALSLHQLKRPITLELKAGEEKNNVLVSARDPETFEPIRTGSWENADWNALMNQALARLGGEVPQPTQSQPKSQPEPAATPTASQTNPQSKPQTINQKQYQDLLAISKRNGYSNAGFAELLGKYGFCRGSEITQKLYPQIWAEACDRNMAMLINARAEQEMIPH
jgi:hypothetical protein